LYHVDRNETTNAVRLTATATEPAALLEAALRGVLAAARSDRPPATPDGATAVPIKGTGPDLELVFTDLAQDLLGQLEEFGPGLDALRLDGLLRTDTGGYTAWGYLSGTTDTIGQPALWLSLGELQITGAADDLRLTCELRLS
jgi:hypothetical protein